jgi:hypothetical protein
VEKINLGSQSNTKALEELGVDGGDDVGQLSWVQRRLRRATRRRNGRESAGGTASCERGVLRARRIARAGRRLRRAQRLYCGVIGTTEACLRGASEAGKLRASKLTASGRVSVWAASPCRRERARGDSLWRGAAIDGGVEQSEECVVRHSGCGGIFFFPSVGRRGSWLS